MAKKRHLTVLQDHQAAPEEPRSAAFLVLIATASSLVAWVVVAMLVNGLLGETLQKSGGVVTAIVNLLGLAAAAGAGGALLAYQAPKRSPWLARASGAMAALVGWGASLGMSQASELPSAPGLGTWSALLGMMVGVAALGATAAFALTKARLLRAPPPPP